MITIQYSNLALVNVTALKPGDLFQYADRHGSHTALLVENDAPRWASWLYLTGPHQFRMGDTGHGGALHYAQAPKVLRLGIHRDDLRVQIDQGQVKRAAAGTLRVGHLLI